MKVSLSDLVRHNKEVFLRVHPGELLMKQSYLAVGCKPWAREVFENHLLKRSEKWHLIERREDLSIEKIREMRPRMIFFLHWSWFVPNEILKEFECIGFHMTDLPFGRGGSPLQNLIVRGYQETTLTCFHLTTSMDAGPVYIKKPLSLQGGAEEIYLRAGRLSADMINSLLRFKRKPYPQKGRVVSFSRRTPRESIIPPLPDLLSLFNFIRMMDAEGYPRAFLNFGQFRLEFSRPALRVGRIKADVTIRCLKETSL